MAALSSLRASLVAATCVSLALIAAAPGCAPQADLEGRPCPCADGYRCCEPAGVCVAEGAACGGGVIASAETVARICGEDHGPVLGPPFTAAALGRLLARRWLLCAVDRAAPRTAIVAHDGIEFSLDGTWGFLRTTPAGYDRSADAGDQGTYQIWNDRLMGTVSPTDTTPAPGLHIEWRNGSVVLNLYFDFEFGPLRLRTVNGGVLWFVGDGSDGTDLVGSEGTSCEADHSICQSGRTCVSEVSAELCARPAANLPRGEGCDQHMVRTCAPPLVCLDVKKQCG